MDLVDRIARLCHEVNRIYCASHGDMSQPRWEEAPEWQRLSERHGVLFLLSNREATPEDSHESWMNEKLADGWSYGPMKDPEAKTHPCLVPYPMLPAEQRYKDELFLTIVRSMMA